MTERCRLSPAALNGLAAANEVFATRASAAGVLLGEHTG